MEKEQIIIDKNTETRTNSFKNLILSKKVLLIAIALVVVLLLIIFFALRSTTKKIVSQDFKSNIETQRKFEQSLPFARIYFSDPSYKLIKGQTYSTFIEIDSKGRSVHDLSMTIRWDPQIIGDVTIAKAEDDKSALSNAFEIIEQSPIPSVGTNTVKLLMGKDTPDQRGGGKILYVIFKALKDSPGQILISNPSITLKDGSIQDQPIPSSLTFTK